ncbi:hypothetical protein T484DRAFT_1741571 [Baffinella frigidus]|nr:hypothetical protein T484DRAFT_1741571 [Cryptophyta sp. CCMP2293]
MGRVSLCTSVALLVVLMAVTDAPPRAFVVSNATKNPTGRVWMRINGARLTEHEFGSWGNGWCATFLARVPGGLEALKTHLRALRQDITYYRSSGGSPDGSDQKHASSLLLEIRKIFDLSTEEFTGLSLLDGPETVQKGRSRVQMPLQMRPLCSEACSSLMVRAITESGQYLLLAPRPSASPAVCTRHPCDA